MWLCSESDGTRSRRKDQKDVLPRDGKDGVDGSWTIYVKESTRLLSVAPC